MRRWVLLVLVLLLPLRLWAADTMALAAALDAAGGHAPCHMAATAADAGEPSATPALPAADAALHPGAADAHTEPDAAASPAGPCLLCGVCHLALGAPAAHPSLPQALPAGPPPAIAAPSEQAEPQRVVEPPRG